MPNINALKSHYPQMEGRFAGSTEQQSKFLNNYKGPNPGLGKDRLQFMKDAHFDHTAREKPIGSGTINKHQYPAYHNPERVDMQASNAYRLR